MDKHSCLNGCSGGGGSGTSTFVIGSTRYETVADSTIEYTGPFTSLALTATGSQRRWTAPFAFTAKKLMLSIPTNTNLDVTVCVIRVNTTDSALTISVPASTSGKFSVSADVAIAEEDDIILKFDNSLNTGSFIYSDFGVECEV